MEANHLGQIRTGAASGYATDLLANPEADTLGVIGSGFQARTQLEAIRAVRPIKTVRVWSRSEEKRRKFAEECSAIAVETAEEAVRGAQIVVTATNSTEPVLEERLDRARNHDQRHGIECRQPAGTARASWCAAPL